MKLNVLLVCYNASEFIEECVNSILMQKTDFDFNVIVADDCSTDDTLEKIKRLDESSAVEFVYLETVGGQCRHKGELQARVRGV